MRLKSAIVRARDSIAVYGIRNIIKNGAGESRGKTKSLGFESLGKSDFESDAIGRGFPIVTDNVEVKLIFAIEGIATDVIVVFEGVSMFAGDSLVSRADFDDKITVFGFGGVVFVD